MHRPEQRPGVRSARRGPCAVLAAQTTLDSGVLLMTPKKRRQLLAAGLLGVLLAAFLISRSNPLGRWPDRDEGSDTLLPGHRFPVQALAFDTDGTTLTSAAYHASSPQGEAEAEVMVWDVGTRQRRALHTQF